MRTTVELRDETVHELKARASKLGKRGFSDLVQEATDRYLSEEMDPDEAARFERLMKLSGPIRGARADRFRRALRERRR